MSEQGDKQAAAETQTKAAAADQTAPPEQLSKLMAHDAKGVAADLDRKALAAAEAAIAEGQRALEQARSQLRQAPPAAAPKPRRKGELVLRILLLVNVAAMIAVAALPQPAGKDQPVAPEHTPAPAHDPVPQAPRLDDPVVRAFAAADRRDYRGAIALLDQYLADSPRLDPAKKANVLLALEHYATQLGDIPAAQEYQRKTEALRSSHSLPEDLIQMAQEAEKNGDVESMRRNYARLLLQQRQIPSALYRHVAEAYLKLGDSYRQEAEQADVRARDEQLRQLREQLRQQAVDNGATPGEKHR